MKSFDCHFVDKRWIPATGSEQLATINPVSEAPLARLRACSKADVDHAVDSSRAAWRHWSVSSIAQRRAALQGLAEALRARGRVFALAMAEEVGAPVSLSNALHIPMPINNIAAMIEGLEQIVWEERVGNARVVRAPVGLIAGITPWNAPLHQMVAKVAGAIGAGCTMILKPSELTPTVTTLFLDAVADSGLPEGVVNMVWGGREVGQWLVEHPGVDMVSFTGSDAVGRQIMQTAAGSLKRLSLELGGKSAALLLDDADFSAAVPFVIRQSMANSGQTCVCQSRLLVPRDKLVQVELLAKEAVGPLVPGDPLAEATRMGPLASRAQFDRVNAMIRQALEEGARLISGGPGRPADHAQGYFVAPTILSRVRPGMQIAQREVFGPVLSIIPYDSEEEAIAIANGTPYGLSGAVWSADPGRAQATAERMRAGQVILNGAPQNLAAPFGGFGLSGFGRENGRFGIEAFLELKSIQGR